MEILFIQKAISNMDLCCNNVYLRHCYIRLDSTFGRSVECKYSDYNNGAKHNYC